MLGITSLEAKLGETRLSDLVLASDLVVRARVVSAEADNRGGGFALLAVEQTFRGALTDRNLRIAWTDEVHDQHILCVGEEWLLFLKHKMDGGVEAARYGRSYWRLGRVFGTDRIVAVYEEPITLVNLDVPGLLTKADVYVRELPRQKNPVERDVVPLDRLVPALARIASEDRD
jgi:hypothetical protein